MEGYCKVARFMGRQDEYAIFRRFKALNAQNLLYLQAELTHLEAQLHSLAQRNGADRVVSSKDWWSLSHSEETDDSEHWDKIVEIRGKLEQYNDTILKQAQIAKFGPPAVYDQEFFRSWLARPDMGNFPLLGLDQECYTEKHDADLVALTSRPAPDVFSRWFTYCVVPWWHHVVGEKFKNPVEDGLDEGVYRYENSILAATVRVITTVLASLFPVCSVTALYFIESNSVRLASVIVASGFFALALALMTNARMIEVFAATSAYAAVNVVFLTNVVYAV
ncbi:hypothetical protein BKA67DRAFT_537543 [Truncatella angustata]|uniref:DUF6594 domain-containing protein n=1 Tax=Truncatella angustata TaxID=152316 RepID=A0A9P8UGF8_9PEZI|nr:uncharacterized protein BKA67DRAFT_537543 [Truncatella angustata]KAH6651683.1 hypothetical protein BKA67DRAFT_537543 [Truncatella angustata]